MLIRENVPLAPLTTLGIGGPARYFVEAKTEEDVAEAVELACSRDLALFILGGGSNLVLADSGFDGVVAKIAIGGITSARGGSLHRSLIAGAGVVWDDLVARTVEDDCVGLECLSGIPGTVGGTPVQNVGAYGQEVSQTISKVRVLDRLTLQVKTLSNAECGFAYRSSIFNRGDCGRYIILQVTFSLRQHGEPSIRYRDLQAHFAAANITPTLANVREAVREIRHKKAMLIVPGDEDSRSAGSFFKNPLVEQAFCEALAARLRSRGLELPSYPAEEGLRKLPAAWLVEHAGFAKGYEKGRAGISRRHALAIVNRGGATAADIVVLKDEIQARVLEEFGIVLQVEPVFVGF